MVFQRIFCNFAGKKQIIMKKILYFVAAIAATTLITTTGTSCKFAPEQQDGDTVAASEFYPEDTSSAHAKKMAKKTAEQAAIVDSTDIFLVGSGSNKDMIQLVSYPSRRDTFIYTKTLHVRVKGNADYNHLVKVDYYLLNGKDSMVKYIEEVKLDTKEK